MPEVDPFTQVHNALFGLLTSWTNFSNAVVEGNRITFTGDDRDPIKDQVSEADLPECRLVPVGGEPAVQRTSSTTTIKRRWVIELATGDQRVDFRLLPLEWEIFRALTRWQGVITTLTWHSKPFVVTALPMSVQDAVTNTDLNRGIIGWTTIWACEVEMAFQTTDMRTP